MPKANGSVSEIHLLRPTAWLQQNGIAEKGKSLYLKLPEMGLDGYATVTDLAHYRVTKSDTATEGEEQKDADGKELGETWGAGMVTGTFKHIANSVYLLRYDNGDSLGVTGTHPLYSLDRQCFVPTEDIKVGEHLLTKSGTITIVSKTLDITPQEVYNLEVGQWHNFLVGVSGVVVHNGPCHWDELLEGSQELKDIYNNIFLPGNRPLNKMFKELTVEENSLLYHYTKHSDKVKFGQSAEYFQKYRTSINSIIEKLPKSKGITFSGQKYPNNIIAKFKNKGYMIDGESELGTMLSTSESVGVAEDFILKKNGNVLLEVHGYSGRNIQKISGFPEKEILYQSDRAYEVKNFYEIAHPTNPNEKILKVILEEL
jgi:hypothetical protein